MEGLGYFIGKSQNRPVNITHFLRLNGRDPAVKASFPVSLLMLVLMRYYQDFLITLKAHLFPRIIAALIQEIRLDPENYPDGCLEKLTSLSKSEPLEGDIGSIYLHSDTLYRHNVLQIQYTTYDCRQGTDTINPNTSRKDFMCLREQDGSNQSPSGKPQTGGTQYVYGRVLGVFHTNVVYGGSGSLDYRRRPFQFLWVRWYTPLVEEKNPRRLNRLKLNPTSEPNSWGFLDPATVLRGAHLIPRFATGRVYEEEGQQRKILSKAAQEHMDWKEYYINQ